MKMSKRLDLFAATISPEAKKAIFSCAVAEGIDYAQAHGRIFLQAHAVREVCMELSEEDAELGMCGRL